MAKACDCNNITLGNSGRPGCTLISSVTNNLIVVPTFDSAGVRNFIDTTVALDSAYFTARVNEDDASKRWYPLPAMKNVSDERAEPISETFGDGTSVVIQQGARAFSGEMIDKDSSFEFLDKLDGYGCADISVYVVDVSGNIIGNGEEADKLYPIRVDSASWFPNLMKPVAGSSVQKIQLTYNYDRNEFDSDLRMITSTETAVDVRDLKGLIDVNSVASAITTTTFTITSTFDYGSQVAKKPFIGALLADWELNEVSPTPGAIVITSATEVADGVYDFVIPSATSGDVLELDLNKDGFEMATVTVTIP